MREADSTAARSFPPGNSGGPIEAVGVGFDQPHLVGFRRVIPAAPLKLGGRQLRLGRPQAFPPGNSGGPIEAPSCDASPATYPTPFPPGNSGGPIEALSYNTFFLICSPFPPGNSGGPIEAALSALTG